MSSPQPIVPEPAGWTSCETMDRESFAIHNSGRFPETRAELRAWRESQRAKLEASRRTQLKMVESPDDQAGLDGPPSSCPSARGVPFNPDRSFPPNFAIVTAWTIRWLVQAGCSGTEIVIYIALRAFVSRHAPSTGRIRAKPVQVAVDTGLPRQTVRNAIGRLVRERQVLERDDDGDLYLRMEPPETDEVPDNA